MGLSAISCGNTKNTSKQFDQKDDGILKFANAFKSDGKQTEALKAIFKTWNNKEEVKRKIEGFLPIEILQLQSQYGAAYNDLSTKLEVKDKTTFYNFVFNYPNTVALLNKYNMNLDLSDVSVNDTIQKEFLKFNERILNVPQGSVYALPLTRSGEVLSINGPVLAFVFAKALDAENTTFTISNDEKTQEFWNKLKTSAGINETTTPFGKDLVKIEKTWGEFSLEGLHNFEFNVKQLNNYKDLFALSNKISKSFKNAFITNENKAQKAYGVLGIDSMTNPIYSMFFSKIGRDYNKFLISPNSNKTGINYSETFNPTSEKAKNFKEIFNTILPNLLNGSTYIRDKDKYSSNYLTNHQMIFALGSTSGYWYSFKKNSDKDLETLQKEELLSVIAPEYFDQNQSQNLVNASIITQGPSLIGIHANEKEDKATKNFIKWFINEKAMKLNETDTEMVTPLTYYSKKGGYISPTKDLFTLSDEELKARFNPFEFAFLAEVKKAINNQKGENFSFMEDPIDTLTGPFREKLDTSIVSYIQRNKGKNPNEAESFEKFLESFKSSLGTKIDRK